MAGENVEDPAQFLHKTTAPELQRFLAERMKAKTIELESSHVSLISHAKEIADLILAAAAYK